MSNEQRIEIRDLRNGDWYWIHKAVIQEYAQKVGATDIIVYSFLASLADSSQSCSPSQKYIAERLGYSRATINRALGRLEENRLIRVERRGRYHCVYLLLKVRCQALENLEADTPSNTGETQMSNRCNSDVHQSYTNNNKRTRNINNIGIEDKNLSSRNAFNGFRPKTRQELLALDLADALNDHKGLARGQGIWASPCFLGRSSWIGV